MSPFARLKHIVLLLAMLLCVCINSSVDQVSRVKMLLSTSSDDFDSSTLVVSLHWGSYSYTCSRNGDTDPVTSGDPFTCSTSDTSLTMTQESESAYSLSFIYGSEADPPSNTLIISKINVRYLNSTQSLTTSSYQDFCIPLQFDSSVNAQNGSISTNCDSDHLYSEFIALDYHSINSFSIDLDIDSEFGIIRLPAPVSFGIYLDGLRTIEDAVFTLFSDGNLLQCIVSEDQTTSIQCDKNSNDAIKSFTECEISDNTDFMLHIESEDNSMWIDSINITFSNNRSYLLYDFCLQFAEIASNYDLNGSCEHDDFWGTFQYTQFCAGSSDEDFCVESDVNIVFPSNLFMQWDNISTNGVGDEIFEALVESSDAIDGTNDLCNLPTTEPTPFPTTIPTEPPTSCTDDEIDACCCESCTVVSQWYLQKCIATGCVWVRSDIGTINSDCSTDISYDDCIDSCGGYSEPTSDPTAAPSPFPTTDPSPNPITSPTLAPSPIPISIPSTEPSSIPSAEPISATIDPTSQPSYAPTSISIPSPTMNPTVDPSHHRSVNPTTNPTAIPVVILLDESDLTPSPNEFSSPIK